MPRGRTGHSKHPLPTTQEKTLVDYILCNQRWSSSIQSAKTRLGADCGSDHELLIAKFRLKLEKERKTTRPFRYDLNQIPYILYSGSEKEIQGIRSDRVPEELWMEVCDILQEAQEVQDDQGHPQGKKKWLSEEALQTAMKRREVKTNGEKER